MTRKTYGWRGRLTQYLVETGSREFGVDWDCALFVAGAVEAMTGEDFAADLRGYGSIERGLVELRRRGFDDHVAYVASLFEEVPVAFAQPGDIAVVPVETGEALGLVQGEAIYVSGIDGRYLVPLLSATRAFRV